MSLHPLQALGNIPVSPEMVALWRNQPGFQQLSGMPGIPMRQFMPQDMLQGNHPVDMQRHSGGLPGGEANSWPIMASGEPANPGSTRQDPQGHGSRGTPFSAPHQGSSFMVSDAFPGMLTAIPNTEVPPAMKAMIDRITDEKVEVAVQKALGRRGPAEHSDDGNNSATPQRKKRHKLITDVPTKLKWAVWAEMHKLLGISVEHDQMATGKKKYYTLPHPLEEGMDVRKNPNGDRLFNPLWGMPIDYGVNARYIEAVKALIMQNGTSPPHSLDANIVEDEKLVLHAIKAYFRTLKAAYKSQNTEAGRAAKETKADRNRINVRSSRKADKIRQGIPTLEKVFGKDKTAGVRHVIHSPWQSEEHSSEGEGGPEREDLRLKSGVSKTAWEVRHRPWRSRKLMLLYFVLAVLARFVHEHKVEFSKGTRVRGRGTCDDNDGDESDSAGSELSEDSRDEFLKRVSASVATWSSVLQDPRNTRDRFRGPVGNYIHLPKGNRLQKAPIYNECISKVWATEHEEHQLLYDAAQPAPESMRIFDLVIPRSLIPKEDLEWLDAKEPEDTAAEEVDPNNSTEPAVEEGSG
ncbi:hypothetical protein BD413DRAFT_673523 [Trametes elegans]|nr:hypothetical protein BD413DRAFT_673523 [Trametes elegans]